MGSSPTTGSMENMADVVKALADEVIGDRPFRCRHSIALFSKSDTQLSLEHKEKYIRLVTKITLRNGCVSFLDLCNKGPTNESHFHNLLEPEGAEEFQKSIGKVIKNFMNAGIV